MYCTRHPKVETNLRCGKCDRPICTKCTVQTPVGARCRDCARLTRLPVFQISLKDYLKAVAVGTGAAAVFGIVWRLAAPHLAGYGYLLALLAGYAIGELVSRVVNRKRGVGLQIVAGVSTLLCFGIAIGIGMNFSLYSIIALAFGVALAASRFR